MPIKVSDLESNNYESFNSLRKKILIYLQKNQDLAFTLKELFEHFLKQDKELPKRYEKSPKVLYNLIYGYLRNYELKGQIIHKGNFYYSNKKSKSKKWKLERTIERE